MHSLIKIHLPIVGLVVNLKLLLFTAAQSLQIILQTIALNWLGLVENDGRNATVVVYSFDYYHVNVYRIIWQALINF